MYSFKDISQAQCKLTDTICLVYSPRTEWNASLNKSNGFFIPFSQINNAFRYNNSFQKFDFRIIRVEQPVVMVVNGRKIGLSKCAPTKLSATVKST